MFLPYTCGLPSSFLNFIVTFATAQLLPWVHLLAQGLHTLVYPFCGVPKSVQGIIKEFSKILNRCENKVSKVHPDFEMYEK
jgi:hypothetical protein